MASDASSIDLIYDRKRTPEVVKKIEISHSDPREPRVDPIMPSEAEFVGLGWAG